MVAPEAPVQLVRYSCGCIGFTVGGQLAYIIRSCEGDMDEWPFCNRDMTADQVDGARPLNRDEMELLCTRLSALVSGGIKMRALKAALDI